MQTANPQVRQMKTLKGRRQDASFPPNQVEVVIRPLSQTPFQPGEMMDYEDSGARIEEVHDMEGRRSTEGISLRSTPYELGQALHPNDHRNFNDDARPNQLQYQQEYQCQVPQHQGLQGRSTPAITQGRATPQSIQQVALSRRDQAPGQMLPPRAQKGFIRNTTQAFQRHQVQQEEMRSTPDRSLGEEQARQQLVVSRSTPARPDSYQDNETPPNPQQVQDMEDDSRASQTAASFAFGKPGPLPFKFQQAMQQEQGQTHHSPQYSAIPAGYPTHGKSEQGRNGVPQPNHHEAPRNAQTLALRSAPKSGFGANPKPVQLRQAGVVANPAQISHIHRRAMYNSRGSVANQVYEDPRTLQTTPKPPSNPDVFHSTPLETPVRKTSKNSQANQGQGGVPNPPISTNFSNQHMTAQPLDVDGFFSDEECKPEDDPNYVADFDLDMGDNSEPENVSVKGKKREAEDSPIAHNQVPSEVKGNEIVIRKAHVRKTVKAPFQIHPPYDDFMAIVSRINVEGIKAKCKAKAERFDAGLEWDHVIDAKASFDACFLDVQEKVEALRKDLGSLKSTKDKVLDEKTKATTRYGEAGSQLSSQCTELQQATTQIKRRRIDGDNKMSSGVPVRN